MQSARWNKQNITENMESVSDNNSEMISMDERLLERLKTCVLDNLENENFGVEDLADEVAFSRSHLYRKIQSLTGQSISAFIRSVRLERAHEMIMADVGTISEIAFKVGFGSSTYFTKCFHDEYGYPPGEAKQNSLNGNIPATDASTDQKETVRSDASLESMHPTAASPLIEEIFRALADHKPSLQKFLIVDEEEGETIDMRLLAYQTIKSFPWPVGVQLRRLFSAGLHEPNSERLDQINKTIRNCLRFTLFIGCSEVCRLIKDGKNCLSSQEAKEVIECLEHFEDKDLLALLQVLDQCLSKEYELLIPELKDLYNESLKRELESWMELSAKSVDENELADTCSALEQSLIVLLKRIAFLAAYKLVNVSSIKVRKPKYRDPLFEHHFHLLNSADSDFRIHEEKLSSFSDSDAVLLMNSIKLTDQVLNLEPFVVDTFEDKQAENTLTRTKRDLYLYSGLRNGKLTYQGSEVTNAVDLSQFHQYEHWLASFALTKEIISGS